MLKDDFKVGDKVQLKSGAIRSLDGKYGVIKGMNKSCAAIEFDDTVNGTTCNNLCKKDHGFYVNYTYFILINRPCLNWLNRL